MHKSVYRYICIKTDGYGTFRCIVHILYICIANCKETLKHWKQNNKHIPIRTIHEHTVTQHLKDIDTYTTHTQLRLRVLACIHDVYNKHTHTHSRYTQMQRHTHILTLSHRKTTHTHAHTSNKTHTTWTGRHAHRGAPVEGCVKSKGWEGTVPSKGCEGTCWTKPVCFVIQFQVLVRNWRSIVELCGKISWCIYVSNSFQVCISVEF